MKKYLVLAPAVVLVLILSNCHSSKKATASAPPKLTYDANVKTAITSYCSPCHIAGKGNKKSYDNFENAKADIDDIIRRIELNPTDRGFMPFKHPKLSDSTIAVFKKWKEDGTLQN